MSKILRILNESEAQYSKVYKVNGKRFRYNYDLAELEYLDPTDGTIIDSVGLSLEDWKEDPKYWCESYANELEENLNYLFDPSEFEEEEEINSEEITQDDSYVLDVTTLAKELIVFGHSLGTLHRNLVGEDFFQLHEALQTYYEKVSDETDFILEYLISKDIKEPTVEEALAERKPVSADSRDAKETLLITQDILKTIVNTSSMIRESLPEDVKSTLDEYTEFYRKEAEYKLEQYLKPSKSTESPEDTDVAPNEENIEEVIDDVNIEES